MSMSDRPVTRARSARNAGIAAAPPLSRTSALMIRITGGAHDVRAVVAEQGRRGEHATLLARPVHVHAREDVKAHPDDPGRDPGPARRPGGPVVPRVDLPGAGQLQGQRVADVLAVDGRELGGDHDLVDTIGVEYPPLEHDRPFDGPGHLVVRGREPGARAGAARSARTRTRQGTRSAPPPRAGRGSCPSRSRAGWAARSRSRAASGPTAGRARSARGEPPRPP